MRGTSLQGDGASGGCVKWGSKNHCLTRRRGDAEEDAEIGSGVMYPVRGWMNA